MQFPGDCSLDSDLQTFIDLPDFSTDFLHLFEGWRSFFDGVFLTEFLQDSVLSSAALFQACRLRHDVTLTAGCRHDVTLRHNVDNNILY